MKNQFLKPRIQLFAEEAPETGESSRQETVAKAQNQQQPPDFDEMLKNNKDFAAWTDRRVTQAVNTAVQNATQKIKTLHDQNVSEAEKLKNMSAQEQAEYFRKKYEDALAEQQRRENARSMEAQVAAMFSEREIPADLLTLFDFAQTGADDVKARVETLAKYEICPKGTFDAKLKAALDEKLRQKPPETHVGKNTERESLEKTIGDPSVKLEQRIAAKNKLLNFKEE